MARKAFYSFHYKPDNWRVSQVRNIGAVEGSASVSDNDWETVTKGGDDDIKKWIAKQLKGRTCTVVLVGEGTAGRKWINHEIKESWKAEIGVVGIRIHKLKNKDGDAAAQGGNPFDHVTIEDEKASSIIKLYNPAGTSSTAAYDSISENIEDWVEEAIKIRNKY